MTVTYGAATVRECWHTTNIHEWRNIMLNSNYVGKHRRLDNGDEDIFEQVVIGGGHIWRWSEQRNAWEVLA